MFNLLIYCCTVDKCTWEGDAVLKRDNQILLAVHLSIRTNVLDTINRSPGPPAHSRTPAKINNHRKRIFELVQYALESADQERRARLRESCEDLLAHLGDKKTVQDCLKGVSQQITPLIEEKVGKLMQTISIIIIVFVILLFYY